MGTNRWTGKGHDGLWSDTANWSLNAEPGSSDTVVFKGTGQGAVSLAGADPSIAALAVLGASVTLVGNRINVTPPGPTALGMLVAGGGTAVIQTIIDSQNAVQIGQTTAAGTTAGTLVLNYGAVWAPSLSIQDGTMRVAAGGAWSPAGADSSIVVGGIAASLAVTAGGTVDPGRATNALLTVGNGFGDGTVSVSGAGALLVQTNIMLGGGYSGHMTIDAGGVVQTVVLQAGMIGDGTLGVSGGGVLAASNEIIIGGQVPVSSTLSIVNGGSVYAGTVGLLLEEGKLVMDSTGTLFGSIYSAGGYLIATARTGHAPGTVTLGQAITLSTLFADGTFGGTTWAESQGGSVLNIAGSISSSFTSTTLRVPSGHVILSHAANSYGMTALYGGTLEIAASGAAGSGAMNFIGGSVAAELVIDRSLPFANSIVGFGAADTIDLRGFGFAPTITDSFAVGTLTVANGSATAMLHFAGSYGAGDFTFAADGHGGTLLGLHA